jgi:hypothetical protein
MSSRIAVIGSQSRDFMIVLLGNVCSDSGSDFVPGMNSA